MGLQLAGDADVTGLISELRGWAKGDWYEKRAAAAGLCEPRLLKTGPSALSTLRMLNQITASMAGAADRTEAGFRTLRQGMAYCWSVAIVAAPAVGKPLFEKWLKTSDADILWIVTQNLSKNRLMRMDPKWVKRCRARIQR